MENFKLETDLRIETIFLSTNKNNLNKLNDIISLKELDNIDQANINKFIYLTNQTESLSLETLKVEFPDLYFDGIQKVSEEALDDYIRLYIASIKNNFISRELFKLSNEVKTTGMNELIITKLNNLSKSDVISIPYKDISKEILQKYEQKAASDDLLTGIKLIDEDSGGLHKGALTTILGYAGSFKTTWAINISYNAIHKAKNVLYLSLEVSKEDIYYDLLSRHSFNNNFKYHIEHSDLKHKKLNNEEFKYLSENIYPDLLKAEGKIYIVDETELEAYSVYSLESKFAEIERLAIEETGKGIDLFIIDHAQLLKFDSNAKNAGNETSVLNNYISFFRKSVLNWCKTGKQIAGLVLSQASREGWKEAVRNEGRYRLTALAEANELERASSLVLSTYCSDSLKQVKAAKVQILKNRDGQSWRRTYRSIRRPSILCIWRSRRFYGDFKLIRCI